MRALVIVLALASSGCGISMHARFCGPWRRADAYNLRSGAQLHQCRQCHNYGPKTECR